MSDDDPGSRPAASRPPPPLVAPLTIDGVRYAQQFGDAAVDGQVGGLLAAVDAAGRTLWTLKVYDNARREDIEGDVQDVFFREMSLEPDGRIRIVNERGQTFLVDVKSRQVDAQAVAAPPRDLNRIRKPRPE